MKKTTLILIGIIIFSFKTEEAKKLKIEFYEPQIQMLWGTLEFCKVSIQSSQSPAVDVRQALINIDSLQKIIRPQYVAQMDTTNKK